MEVSNAELLADRAIQEAGEITILGCVVEEDRRVVQVTGQKSASGRQNSCCGEAALQGCRAEHEVAKQTGNIGKHKFPQLTAAI